MWGKGWGRGPSPAWGVPFAWVPAWGVPSRHRETELRRPSAPGRGASPLARRTILPIERPSFASKRAPPSGFPEPIHGTSGFCLLCFKTQGQRLTKTFYYRHHQTHAEAKRTASCTWPPAPTFMNIFQSCLPRSLMLFCFFFSGVF